MTDIIDRLERYAGGTCLSTMTELAAAAEIKKSRDEVEWLRAVIEAMKQQNPAAWQRQHRSFGPDVWVETTESVAERLKTEDGWKVRPLYLAPGAQSDLNLSCKSVQKRLAAQWGYVKKGDAQAVPEGFQLVPIEPTPEMLARTSAPGCAKSDWEKMIAAAPKPEEG